MAPPARGGGSRGAARARRPARAPPSPSPDDDDTVATVPDLRGMRRAAAVPPDFPPDLDPTAANVRAFARARAAYGPAAAFATARPLLFPPTGDGASADTACSVCRRYEADSAHDAALRHWVGCDYCARWAHAACVHTPMDQLARLARYACPVCVVERGAAAECDADPPLARDVTQRMRGVYFAYRHAAAVDLDRLVERLLRDAVAAPPGSPVATPAHHSLPTPPSGTSLGRSDDTPRENIPQPVPSPPPSLLKRAAARGLESPLSASRSPLLHIK